jgi:S1-C subfamily serine protease
LRHYTSGYRGTGSFAGGYLGVSFDPQSRNVAVISQVNANSPAEAAGLQRGDVIRAVNGREIKSAYEPSSIIRQYAPGTEVTLSIERDR